MAAEHLGQEDPLVVLYRLLVQIQQALMSFVALVDNVRQGANEVRFKKDGSAIDTSGLSHLAYLLRDAIKATSELSPESLRRLSEIAGENWIMCLQRQVLANLDCWPGTHDKIPRKLEQFTEQAKALSVNPIPYWQQLAEIIHDRFVPDLWVEKLARDAPETDNEFSTTAPDSHDVELPGPRANPAQSTPRISVNADTLVVIIDGQNYPLKGSEKAQRRLAEYIQDCIDADGEPVPRPQGLKTKHIESQHKVIQDLFDAKPGGGTRIPRKKLWPI